MKLYYTRYTELSCFTIRGFVGKHEWKMLQLGFDLLFKDLENMLLINMVHVQLQPEIVPVILEYKKTFEKQSKHKILIVCKERGVGDFPKIETFLSRYQGSKMRQIADKLLLHDENYALEQETQAIEAQIKQLGFDDTSSKLAIQKNAMVKTQQKALDGCMKWQRLRKGHWQKVPSDVEDLETKIKNNVDEITKIMGKPVDL